MSSNVLGSASISGLVSGLNASSIVSQLMAVEQQKVSLLQTQQAQQTATQTALSTLNTDLQSLRSQSLNLSDTSTFLSYTSSLANATSGSTVDPTTLLSVTPGSTAAPGTHTFVVNTLAAAEKLSSSAAVADSGGTAITSTSTALNMTGSFTIQGKSSSAQTVSIVSTDSLSNIVTKINQLNTGTDPTGVTASILQVGSSDFRLVLTSDTTGSTGTTGLTGTDLNAGGALANLNLGATGQTNAYTTMQPATDASLKVDGVSITRSSNTITDALSGYTLNLLKADSGVTISSTTAADQTAIKTKIQGFVDSYNKIMTFINSEMAFDTKTQTNGILASSSTVRYIQQQLASSILTDVPGLASDRNNLALIGIAPDSNGQLQIDSTKLDSFLSSDPTAVSNLFAASGTSSNSSLQFLTAGLNSTSGTYSVDITQAATQASVTGTQSLSGGLGGTAGGTDLITVTDGLGQQAAVTLNVGDSLSSIITALNNNFNTATTEKHQMSGALYSGAATAASSSTLLTSLTDNTGASLGVAAGDSITIGGTSRTGSSVASSYTVTSTSTVGDLLTAIQSSFNQQATATLSSGQITLTDNSTGTSSLSLSLSSDNAGGGTLSFGTDSQITQGRYAMDLSAVASGNNLQIISNNYGSTASIASVTETLTNSTGVGLAGQTSTGVDVAGTIDGLAATGSGQLLTGASGNANGMALLYTGTTTAAGISLSASLGIGTVYYGQLDTFSNPVTGLIQTDITSAQSVYDSLQTQIDDMNTRIKQETDTLTQSFLQLEQTMSSFNSANQFISQQFSSTAANSSSSSSFR